MFENPWSATSWNTQQKAAYHVFEQMKTGAWVDEHYLLKVLAEAMLPKGSKSKAFDYIITEGRKPVPPKFPLGRWTLERRRGQARLNLNSEVESVGIDEESVKALVTKQLDDSVVARIQSLMAEAGEEQVKLIAGQIEEMKKSSVPVLELLRYTENGKKEVKTIQPSHESMAELLYYLSLRDHVYLYDGPGNSGPGSGKTTAAIMAAMALKLGKGWDVTNPATGKKEKSYFGYISLTPQTFESRLFGYMDANGKYVSTDFRKCYEFGGTFLIDEGDNGGGNLYTALNGALENNYCSFPDKVVRRHPDFVVVMTGNTSGGGPNPMFPTRRPFDKAFAERFTYIGWNYDERLERIVAMAINAAVAPIWHEYMTRLRTYCKAHYPMVLVSPRATFKGCKYMKDGVIPLEKMMDGIIFKGYDKDSVKNILAANPAPYDELKAAIVEYQNTGKRHAKKGSHRD